MKDKNTENIHFIVSNFSFKQYIQLVMMVNKNAKDLIKTVKLRSIGK